MLNFPMMFELTVDFAKGGFDLGKAVKAVEKAFSDNPRVWHIQFLVSCANTSDGPKLDEAVGKLRQDLQNTENAKQVISLAGASRNVVLTFDAPFLEAELLD